MYVYITCDLYLFLYIFLYLVCNNRPHLRICIRLKGTIPEKRNVFNNAFEKNNSTLTYVLVRVVFVSVLQILFNYRFCL